ncbi:MAG: hypothetical protein HQ494_11640 [Rhodospirillales bacterium]|nr:hypothetical protein [Rhodospirillales bacterium]
MALKRLIPPVLFRVLILVAMVSLAACEKWSLPKLPSLPGFPSLASISGEGPETADDVDCEAATRLNLQAMDWKDAKRIDIYSRKNGLTPSSVVMTVNTPNILRLYNGTREVLNFRAQEFFQQAAVFKIIYGGKDVSETCIEAIRIGPLKWAEIRVVPLRQGEFSFRDDNSYGLSSLIAGNDPPSPGHIIVR